MTTLSANGGPAALLFSKTRRAVLSLLYHHAGEAFYLRQIVRATGSGLGPAQRELKKLADAGIIRRTARGRQIYYQANGQCPVFAELRSLLAGGVPVKAPEPRAVTHGRAERNIKVPQEKLTEFCQRRHITRLAFFGSVLRDDFRPDSDIDVLVEFEPGHVPGFGIVDIERELSGMLGCKVDLRTPGDLSHYFREQVIQEAEVQYSAAQR